MGLWWVMDCAVLQNSCAVLSSSSRRIVCKTLEGVISVLFSNRQTWLKHAIQFQALHALLKKDVGKQDRRIATSTAGGLGNVSYEERWNLIV